jgi:two-component system response regulator CpxR
LSPTLHPRSQESLALFPIRRHTEPLYPLKEKQSKMRPKKVILCVDDNEQVLSVRTFLLETRGYRVLSATTAQQALDMLQQITPGTLDLLISDLLLPQMDGNELVRRAKQIHPTLPTLIISGTVTSFDRALAADAFLPKGASSAVELLERVRVLVARKRGPKKQLPRPMVTEPAPAEQPHLHHQIARAS